MIDHYTKKGLLEKAATIKIIEYSPLWNELKKQTDIGKNQYKVLKDQINIINSNREDSIKAENGIKREDGAITKHDEIIDNVGYFYTVDEYKNLIDTIFSVCINQWRFVPYKFW